MKIAAISDMHGNIVALDAVLRDIETQSVDTVICLGDIAYKGPAPSECIRKIRELRIPCVYGNTDLYLLEAAGHTCNGSGSTSQPAAAHPYLTWHTDRMDQADLTYLLHLPMEYRIESDGQSFLFVHGTPKDCNAAIRPGDTMEHLAKHIDEVQADWIIMGHIHTPFLFRSHQKAFVNTGAVGFSLDGDWRASYTILDTADGSLSFRKVEYDIDKIVSIAKETKFCFSPEWYGDALKKGWWEPIPYERRTAIDRFP